MVEVKGTALDTKLKRKLPAMPWLFGKTDLQGKDHLEDYVGDSVEWMSASEAVGKVIDLKDWMTAASLTVKVQLEPLLNLFDKDRHIDEMEVWCFPRFVHENILKWQNLVVW